MQIQWNKVTWYSKIVALALFVALPFIGFYYGMQYGKLIAPLGQPQQQQQASGNGDVDYYHNVSAWQTDAEDTNFSIAQPLDFPLDEIHSAGPSLEWRLGANGTPGNLSLTVTIPSAFEPQTNFSDARLTVGHSGSDLALANCLTPDANGGPAQPPAKAIVNGVTFTVFHFADAGAGNFYETTSYRTVHAGQCYAIEYTIHSSQIANYPVEYQLQPFNKAKLADVLDRMVGTFRFP